jgi:hypothetical protein
VKKLLTMVLSHMVFIMLSKFFLPIILWDFFKSWKMIFIKCSLWIYWNDHMVFFYPSFCQCSVLHYQFVYVELSLHFSDKSLLIIDNDPFNVLLN